MKITEKASPLFVLRCVKGMTGHRKVTLRKPWGMLCATVRAMETHGECSIGWVLM